MTQANIQRLSGEGGVGNHRTRAVVSTSGLSYVAAKLSYQMLSCDRLFSPVIICPGIPGMASGDVDKEVDFKKRRREEGRGEKEGGGEVL